MKKQKHELFISHFFPSTVSGLRAKHRLLDETYTNTSNWTRHLRHCSKVSRPEVVVQILRCATDQALPLALSDVNAGYPQWPFRV